MPESALVDAYVESVQASLVRWGPAMTFGVMFMESVPIAGFIAPGLTVLVVAGFVASGQPAGCAALWLVAAFSGVAVADTLAYTAGRGSHRLSSVRRLVARHERLRCELSAQPTCVLVLYQFPPYSRMFAPLLMGALSFSWKRWIPLMTMGTSAFVLSFFGLGYAAGRTGHAVFGAHNAAGAVNALFVVALVAWLGRIAIRLRRQRRTSSQRTS